MTDQKLLEKFIKSEPITKGWSEDQGIKEREVFKRLIPDDFMDYNFYVYPKDSEENRRQTNDTVFRTLGVVRRRASSPDYYLYIGYADDVPVVMASFQFDENMSTRLDEVIFHIGGE